jgi:hypothetical protein
MIKENVRWWKM